MEETLASGVISSRVKHKKVLNENAPSNAPDVSPVKRELVPMNTKTDKENHLSGVGKQHTYYSTLEEECADDSYLSRGMPQSEGDSDDDNASYTSPTSQSGSTAGDAVIYANSPRQGSPSSVVFTGNLNCTPVSCFSDTNDQHPPADADLEGTPVSIVPSDADESFCMTVEMAKQPATLKLNKLPTMRRYGQILCSPPSCNVSLVEDSSSKVAVQAEDRQPEPKYATPKRGEMKGRTEPVYSILMPAQSPKPCEKEKTCAASTATLSKQCQATVEKEPLYASVAPIKRRTPNVFTTDRNIGEPPRKMTSPHRSHDQLTAAEQRIKCLQEAIDRASDVERQASHALDLCFANDACGTPQELEAERLLLVSSLKLSRCTSELECARRLQNAMSASAEKENSICRATLSLSDIQLPLGLAFLGSLGQDSVGFFTIVTRTAPEVVAATHVVSTSTAVSLNSTLLFRDTLTLSPVMPSFQLDIDVYYMVLGEKHSASASGTPIKRRKKLDVSLGTRLSQKKARAAIQTRAHVAAAGQDNASHITRFTKVASCQLDLSTIKRDCSCKLQEWSSQSIMYGNLTFTATGTPHYKEHSYTGFLTWREEISGQPNWRRFFCELLGAELLAWQYPHDRDTEEPKRRLDFTHYGRKYQLQAGAADRLVCIRKNAIMVSASPRTTSEAEESDHDSTQHLYFADTKEDCLAWIAAFKQAICDMDAWLNLPIEA